MFLLVKHNPVDPSTLSSKSPKVGDLLLVVKGDKLSEADSSIYCGFSRYHILNPKYNMWLPECDIDVVKVVPHNSVLMYLIVLFGSHFKIINLNEGRYRLSIKLSFTFRNPLRSLL